MNLVKHIATMAMVAFAAIAIGACNGNDEPDENPKLNHNLTLEVDIDNILSESAKVKVTHNGTSEDTWYGFLTSEVEKSEKLLIDEEVARYLVSSAPTALRSTKSYVQILTNLTPGTTYKYIAFGLSEEGEVYGNYGALEFTTQGNSGGNGGGSGDNGEGGGGGGEVNGMRENSAWSVEYIGAGTLYEQNFDHIVKVTSVDKNPYLMTVVYATEWDPTQLRELANYVVADLKNYIDEFNDYYGSSSTIADWLFVGDGYDAFNLVPGYYKAVALGVDEKGEVTGLYAVSETFEVKEQTASAAFRAWLGNWDIVGNNEVTYTINLSNGLANKFFYMSYWEGDMDFVVQVDYNAELDAIFFYSQSIQEDVNFGDYGYGDLYFLGLDREGGLYTTESGDYGIAIGGILDGGQRAIVRYDDDSVQGYPFFDYMQFIADLDGKYYRLTNSELLQLPAAMNPAGGQVAVSPKVAERNVPTPLRTKVSRPRNHIHKVFNF
ncbi:MAG: hypothetical protein J6V28_03670 [Tidjanibacter sp.]|nr:hypothetical protein [Tidjanibacter sp.]